MTFRPYLTVSLAFFIVFLADGKSIALIVFNVNYIFWQFIKAANGQLNSPS